jgi:hypothetical protein
MSLSNRVGSENNAFIDWGETAVALIQLRKVSIEESMEKGLCFAGNLEGTLKSGSPSFQRVFKSVTVKNISNTNVHKLVIQNKTDRYEQEFKFSASLSMFLYE